ncbi:hypothetical protein [Protaetiibacter mangrovi]|uniref:Uncharacterized protein n=1 Tax=Protaetiibacter mangrovi TaxID=2970926 RepID=A0ABT1ZGP0_9MICO|nr:hypothetical protein [Protaetiibacter mangrovi]MCS0499878.1 hypothetical protein [Protaetiibacter mangrovi]
MGKALSRGDTSGRSYRVADLLASSRSGGGSSASGDGREGRTQPAFTRQAARGALVLAAVEAVEAGDDAELAELGIDLSQLDGLSGMALYLELSALILGPSSHPDDQAVAEAVLATLASGQTGSTLAARIGQFVSALAWQLAKVQLSARKDIRARADGAVKAFETKVKNWIRARVNQVADVLTSKSPQNVADYASGLAARACKEFVEGTS